MPVSARDDAKLTELRDKYQAKTAEADAILDDPASTGAMLTKAEKIIGECDALKSEIEARQAELDRGEALRGRRDGHKTWSYQPAGGPPMSGKSYEAGGGAGRFAYAGSEDAGHTEYEFDPRAMHFRAVAEAGAGTFGQKTWDTLRTVQYRHDFAQYLRKGQRFADLCTKTLMEGQDDQGGVFAPAELINRIIGRLPAPTQLRSLVNVMTTGRDTLVMPRKQYSADDKYSTAFRANWTGEVPADGTGAQTAVNDANLTGNVSVPVHTAMLSAPVTKNLIEDAAFPIQAWLESELNQIIDLLYEDMILNGSGVGQPTGILLGAASGNDGTSAKYPEVVLSGVAAGLSHDGLIDLMTALAPQYENDGTRWIMNKKSTYRALNKLKDDQKRPLFTTGYNDSGLVGGRGRVLLGDQVVLSQFMPDVGAANFPLIYGDLKGYYLAQRVGFSIQVLDQTRAKANQIELVGRVRFGGAPIEPFRIKIQKSNDS